MLTYRNVVAREISTFVKNEGVKLVFDVVSETDGQTARNIGLIIFEALVQEKGREWIERREIEITAADRESIRAGLQTMEMYLHSSRVTGEIEKEAYFEPIEGLRIGYVNKRGAYNCYLRSTKDDLVIEVQFDDMKGLWDIVNSLGRLA